MTIRVAVLIAVLAGCTGSAAQAAPLEDLSATSVSALEFGAFKLETALSNNKGWPFPIDGADVSFHRNPDKIEILIGVSEVRRSTVRSACAQTVTRVREFLNVDEKGVPWAMGHSGLGAYFAGPWYGEAREAARKTLDAITTIRVLVVGGAICKAPLLNAPVDFESSP